jgi:hypothetical protein
MIVGVGVSEGVCVSVIGAGCHERSSADAGFFFKGFDAAGVHGSRIHAGSLEAGVWEEFEY